LAAALVVSLAAGIIGFAWQAREARAEAERARSAAEAANVQLEFLRDFLDIFVPNNAELAGLDRDVLLKEAIGRAEQRLQGQPALLARVKLQIGDIYTMLDQPEAAAVLFEAADALLVGREDQHRRL